MTDEKKPPPDEYSAFRRLLDRIAKVSKKEIDEKEREYREERGTRKKRSVGSGNF